MKWRVYAGILAMSVSVHPASAVGPDGRFSVKGPGGSSCGTWTESRKDAVAGANNVSWMLGYVTAYGRYGWSLSSNVAADTDNIGLVAWMDNYCAAHPLEEIEDAAHALVLELGERYVRQHLTNPDPK
jgi:hypothetical protein